MQPRAVNIANEATPPAYPSEASSPSGGFPRRIYHTRRQRRRSSWLSISYDQSFRSQPTRPLLRLTSDDGRTIEHILPAAVFGTAHWIGFITAAFVELEILIYQATTDDFRITRVAEVGLLELQRQLWNRGVRQLVHFWTRDMWSILTRRENAIPFLPDRYPLTNVAALMTRRSRPVELDGFDRPFLHTSKGPLVEFVLCIPTDFVPTELAATVASLQDQAVHGWHLTIVVSDKSAAAVMATIAPAGALVPNVGVVEFPAAESCEAALNRHIEHAEGRMIAFLDCGDRLSPESMLAICAEIDPRSRPAILYTDRASIDASGRITSPRLEPDWSPEYFRSVDDAGGLWMFDAALVKSLAPALADVLVPLRRRLALALFDRVSPDRIRHLRRMLLFRPERAAAPERQPTPPGPPAIPSMRPKASIIIPTRDRFDLLRRAVESVRKQTSYDNYEIIIVDNASNERPVIEYLSQLRAEGVARIVEDRGGFNFPRLMNRAVAQAAGEVVVLLNNDTFVMEPNWLGELVRLAVQPGVGAVGAKLLYPDGTIQHAGVVIGLRGYAGHFFLHMPGDHKDHLCRLQSVHEVSAVTAACLAVTRAHFDAVGGLDESLAVDFNDVDFCLRLGKLGLRTLWTPHAVLGHVESASRIEPRHQRSARFRAEAERFAQRWKSQMVNDPYFHPALALRVFDEMIE